MDKSSKSDKSMQRPPCDAKLKALSEERQAEIYMYRETHTTEETQQWLAQEKFTISMTALRHWFDWYKTKTEAVLLEAGIKQDMLAYRQLHPDATQEELDELGEHIFNALAIRRRDIKVWTLAQQIRLKRQEYLLRKKEVQNDTRKVDLEVKKYKDQKARTGKTGEKSKPALTPEQKQQRIKQALGIS